MSNCDEREINENVWSVATGGQTVVYKTTVIYFWPLISESTWRGEVKAWPPLSSDRQAIISLVLGRTHSSN